MPVKLDYADIQGNILAAYGRQGFPKGRFLLFNIARGEAQAGRKFVDGILPRITTAMAWKSRRNPNSASMPDKPPPVAINIAFAWYGLLALEVPVRTLRGMPDEFIDGMMNRASVLGDDFNKNGWEKTWDEVWTRGGRGRDSNEHTVHILVTLNAQMDRGTGAAVPELEDITQWITDLARYCGGVSLLGGHNLPGQPEQPYQNLSALIENEDGSYKPLPKEHFGFDDGIGDPVFDGQFPDGQERDRARGNGALVSQDKWRPIATGEFLLGYPDEAQEVAGAAMPLSFSRNGTFMAYRKLHQNVAAFRDFLDRAAADFQAVFNIVSPEEARETLMAKMAGRWSDGVPVSVAPTLAEREKFNAAFPPGDPEARYAALTNFAYRDDPDGTSCPLTAHIRRVNTRDALDPLHGSSSALNNRRRILRRGLPYGGSPKGTANEDEHGIVLLAVCASLFRQFEFVQQQWINYGLDARAGNDTCPIVGNHLDGTRWEHGPKAKFVIPARPDSGHPPFIVEGIPQFVETRGGGYFFVPSMTALRMISLGVVDPT